MSEAAPRIRAEPSAADPHSMRFRLERSVADGPPILFEAPEEAADVPLPSALFALDGVAAVHVADSVITVAKRADVDWSELKGAIATAIRGVLAQNAAPVGTGAAPSPQERGPEDDAALHKAVQRVLDAEANPAIARHGGKVSVAAVHAGVVDIEMSGGCQGCAASAATLRDGVERILRRALPRIREIRDVTDHAAGQSPYYAQAPGGATATPFARPLPPGTVSYHEGRIVVAPDYLAPRLGLDPETLRAEIRAGRVLSREERGEGADAGKVRLTARHGRRAWAAEIGPDGAAVEIPPPRR